MRNQLQRRTRDTIMQQVLAGGFKNRMSMGMSGGGGINAAFNMPLNIDASSSAGDLGDVTMTRDSDFTYIDPDGVLRYATGSRTNLWVNSDPAPTLGSELVTSFGDMGGSAGGYVESAGEAYNGMDVTRITSDGTGTYFGLKSNNFTQTDTKSYLITAWVRASESLSMRTKLYIPSDNLNFTATTEWQLVTFLEVADDTSTNSYQTFYCLETGADKWFEYAGISVKEYTATSGFTFTETYAIPYDWGISPNGYALENAIVFGDNSVNREIYDGFLGSAQVGNSTIVSFYVEMDDGSVPVPGVNDSTGDFSVRVDGSSSAESVSTEHVSGIIYRVWFRQDVYNNVSPNVSIRKRTTQSSKGFKVSGFQVEELPSANTISAELMTNTGDRDFSEGVTWTGGTLATETTQTPTSGDTHLATKDGEAMVFDDNIDFTDIGGNDYSGTDAGSTPYRFVFTDSAGKTATAYGGAAGGGETLGAELVTGWAAVTGKEPDTLTTSGSAITEAANTTGIDQRFVSTGTPAEVGRIKKTAITATVNSGNPMQLLAISDTGSYFGINDYLAPATSTRYYTSIGVRLLSGFRMAAVCNFSVASISVKELTDVPATGIHLMSSYNGTTRNMESVDTDFNPNDIVSIEIQDAAKFNSVGDLTITADAADQYITLPVASAPMVEGNWYILEFDVDNIVETWTVSDYDDGFEIGTISADGTDQQIIFQYNDASSGGLRLTADAATSSGDFDNFSLKQLPAWVVEHSKLGPELSLDFSFDDSELWNVNNGTISNSSLVFYVIGNAYDTTYNYSAGYYYIDVVGTGGITARLSSDDAVDESGELTLPTSIVYNAENGINRIQIYSLSGGASIDSFSVKEILDPAIQPGAYTETTDSTAAIPVTVPIEADGLAFMGSAAVNLIPYSEDFSEWSTADTPVLSASSVLGPDGKSTATNILDNVTDGDSSINISVDVSVEDAAYNFSIFIKKRTTASLTYPYILTSFQGTTSIYARLLFDPYNGSVLTLGLDNYEVIDCGDWWRVSMVYSNVATNNNDIARMYVYAARTDDFESVDAVDSVTGNIDIFGAQITKGAQLYPYIPTRGTPTAMMPTENVWWVMSDKLKYILGETSFGDELVTDGDGSSDYFTTTYGGGWSYDAVGEKWDCDGSQVTPAYVAQNDVAPSNYGGFYEITFTVSNYSAGEVWCALHNARVDTAMVSENGTFTEIISGYTGDSTSNDRLYLYADVDFVGTIDDISVKEAYGLTPGEGTVIVEWTPGWVGDPNSSSGILSTVDSSSDSLFYFGSGGKLRVYDETNYTDVDLTTNLASIKTYISAIYFSKTGNILGIGTLPSGASWTWSDVDPFDGSFEIETYLSIGILNTHNFHIKNIRIFDRALTTAEIERIA